MRAAVMIDGGHVRVLARMANKTFDPDYIEKIAHAAVLADETLFRVLYYDCAPFDRTVNKPVSGAVHTFAGNSGWLKVLAKKDLFAVRLGVLKFRGWVPKKTPLAAGTLKDEDFDAKFEQKGVDMRIGLDVATFCQTRAVDRIVLATNDTDCVPAMKFARKAGLQVVLLTFPNSSPAPELLWHADYERKVAWPN